MRYVAGETIELLIAVLLGAALLTLVTGAAVAWQHVAATVGGSL
jgi:hypothetical protein